MNHERTARSAVLRPTAAFVGAVVLMVGFAVFFARVRPVAAEDPTTTTSTSLEPTTTEPPTTEPPTTQAPTTTTTRRPSTTTTQRQSTTTVEPTSTTVEESTTTSTVAPTTTEAPTIITPSTVDGGSGGADAGLSTNAKLALVIGGLLAVALAIAVLTFFYWRHTKPVPVAGDEDVDGDAPREPTHVAPAPAPVAASTAAVAVSSAKGSNGPATEEIPTVPPSAADDPGRHRLPTTAEPAVALATTETGAGAEASEPIPDLWANGTELPANADEDAALREVLFGAAPVAPANLPPVTLEDLFGSMDDPKGPAQP